MFSFTNECDEKGQTRLFLRKSWNEYDYGNNTSNAFYPLGKCRKQYIFPHHPTTRDMAATHLTVNVHCTKNLENIQLFLFLRKMSF